MRLIVDVYDASWNRVGEGPVIEARQASVEKRLDEVGTLKITVPADKRAIDLFKNERRVIIRVERLGNALVEWGSGIIRGVSYTSNEGGYRLSVECVDMLDELKRTTIGINREYNDEQVQAIVSDLIGLSPFGWTSTCAVADRLSARFDAISIYKAISEVAKLQGLHLRLTSRNQVEVGVFGASSGKVLMNIQGGVNPALINNGDVGFIEDIRMSYNSEPVVNRLFVLGAGANADSALTLEASTRTTPYTVQSMVMNGRTVYYLEDSASVAEYGVIEKVGQFKEIAPLSNGDTDIERASNALYDIASAWLSRHAQPHIGYTVRLKKLPEGLAVGDTIRLIYREPVLRADGSFTPPYEIDDDFFIMAIEESIGRDGMTHKLKISNVDRHEESTARNIIGQLEQIRLQGTTVQPTINHFQVGPEQVEIDATNSGTVQLILTDATFSVDRVLMRVRTQPFTSTSTGAASGGGASTINIPAHRHLVASLTSLSGFPSTSVRPYIGANGSGGSFLYMKLETSTDSDFWTKDAGGSATLNLPNHTHPAQYGIYRDSSTPGGMDITVNGVSVASGVGTAGVNFDQTYDVTDAIADKVGGFRTSHDVIIACASGQGEVLVTFDVYETITPFKFG